MLDVASQVTSRPEAYAVTADSVEVEFAGNNRVLAGVDLKVKAGEIAVIIGPSGCGKSTLLNLVAGVLTPNRGRIECFGSPVNGLNRRVAYMTQRDTLLPWRSSIDNAALPLEIKGVPRKERRARARVELDRLGLGNFTNHKPHQLSGGMRSRLSLARALLTDTDVLLMDEPFAAIDALLRIKLQQLLVDVWSETHKTILYVTHDLNEAISLAHRIFVMGHGKVLTTRTVDVPHPRDVARFRASDFARGLYVEIWDFLENDLARPPG
jgi:NitT/TauT family transport system ATP-binding protein